MDLIAVVEASLHWGDILVFVAFILLTLAIGVYYGVVAKTKANSADDFLKGDEDVQVSLVQDCSNSSALAME